MCIRDRSRDPYRRVPRAMPAGLINRSARRSHELKSAKVHPEVAMNTLPPDLSVPDNHTAYRVCPLCEATCGLELTISGGAISGVRGDRQDVFSKGFICPKGAAFDRLDNDPDRLRRPMVRQGERWREVGWDEAFAVVAAGLGGVVAAHGRQAVSIYLGNPNVHTLAGGLYAAGLARALGSVSYTHLRAHETVLDLVCRLLLEKKK